VLFSIVPLRKLIGSPYQIASEICRYGHERKLKANLAIASNPDAAILLARHFIGVTLVTPGEEKFKIASIALASLFTHDIPVDSKLLEVLHRWGLKTCEDLAALPEQGVVERLGPAGAYLRNLACGTINRPLRIPAPVTNYEERMELEHPLDVLEPLLFLLGRALGELCRRLRSQSMAARLLETTFKLEANKQYHCQLEFPVPLDESQTLLKLLQLHLERHPPEAAVLAFTLRIEPAGPKRVQGGFFLPPTPPPDKLQITLARIAGMVGKEHVGAPRLLNTHRPDAFDIGPFNTSAKESIQETVDDTTAQQQTLRLAIRLFRPALHAHVRLAGDAPKNIVASGVKGNVIKSAGPWKTSGEWWAATAWIREEWDVALDDGALYRIYQEMQTREWYVHGIYD
jgi:protein ImuB